MGNTYDDSSIENLVGAERIRKRPASMLGSSGLAGARHGFTEIYGNALDERSAGYGDRLDIRLHADGSISVRDYGRGVPIGWNTKSSNWNWHNIFNELYGGGKYDNNQELLKQEKDWAHFDERKYNYLYSVGLNGLGAASTQYTSEFFEVRSYRGGKCYSRSFKKGIPLVNGEPVDMFSLTTDEIKNIPEEVEPTNEPDGTYIHWKPDAEVFDDVNIGGDWLLSVCQDISGVAGIDLHFQDDINHVEKEYQSGTLVDVVKKYAGSSLLTDENGNPYIYSTNKFNHGMIKVEAKDFIWVGKADIVFTLTKHKVQNACFHNSVKMLSGVQYEAIDSALYTFLNNEAKKAGVKISTSDYEDSFCVVVSSYTNYASFRNQTKDAVDDGFIYNLIYQAMIDKLNFEFAKGNTAITELVERVINEARIRISVKEQEKIIREAVKVKREKAPDKFTSCDAYEKKDYAKAELWITEGDSAKGSVKDARDKTFQAIYPIRGKGLNVAKASIDKILANKEIREIFALIGTGFDLNIKGEKTFNIEDLKFGKIIFATDADEDGYQIRVLLFLIFYKLAPQLILDGHIYIAETPRFKIDMSNGSSVYAKDDKERDKILKANVGKVRKVSRFKGLGEVDADVLRETTVAPESRNLIPVTCDLSNNTERDLIDALFGMDKFKQRKDIISTVLGCEVADMLEENALLIQEIENEDIEDNTEYIKVE